MDFFKKIELAPPDPILGIGIAFNNDKREKKINLGIGSYKTADLKPFLLPSVEEAEKYILSQKWNKEYLPIDGDPLFISQVKTLVFKEDSPAIAVSQTVGGTGALRVGGNFLFSSGFKKIFLPDPTWDNHHRIFKQAGFEVASYPYYNAETKSFDFAAMMEGIEKMPPSSVILLQACCHNPTGFDPTLDEWKKIALALEKREIFPFFDFAYQGFGKGVEEDAASIRHFYSKKMQFLVASSYSKNFGLYAERVGALFVSCGTEEESKRVQSQIKTIIRGIYSNPPCHGARIIKTILNDPQRKKEWLSEVDAMRLRITEMRKALVLSLEVRLKTGDHSFEFMKKQSGMFSYTGLSSQSVEILIEEHAIYVPKDGRINVAGLNTQIIDTVADAIIEVRSIQVKS